MHMAQPILGANRRWPSPGLGVCATLWWYCITASVLFSGVIFVIGIEDPVLDGNNLLKGTEK